ncbi:MAG: hypothetical protein HPY83_19385 [Anaerolineae bacterium]|nr:hypothetical protein [Anaerolineae bacterium]
MSDDTELLSWYWPKGPEWLANRLSALSKYGCASFRLVTLCKSRSGLEVPAVMIGRGPTRLLLTGGQHGGENAGPVALYCLIDALVTGVSCLGEDVANWAGAVLEGMTIFAVPMLNVEAMARFVRLFPEAWTGDWFPQEQYQYAHREIWSVLLHLYDAPDAPGRRRSHIPPKTWDRWVQRGWPGMRFTDEGVDLYRDLPVRGASRSVISQALRHRACEFAPQFAVDIHNDAKPSSAHAPVRRAAPRDVDWLVGIAEQLNEAARHNGFPVAPEVTPYGRDARSTPYFYYHGLGVGTVFLEIDDGTRYPYPAPKNAPIATRREVIGTLWSMMRRLTEIGLSTGYRRPSSAG